VPTSEGDSVTNWQDRITIDPKILVGKPIIKGTRIAVKFVMDLLGRGWTPEQILREHDHLTPDDIQGAWPTPAMS
jgi:uncharacterized protein (DUF433 family)